MQGKKALLAGLATVAALLTVTACSDSSTEPTGFSSSTPPSTAASPATAHNQADVMFSQHMIPHHRQAIEMSDIILGKQGIDSRVTDMAEQIKAAQGPEIQQMQSWLAGWGMPTMPMTPGTAGMPGMDGMMSPADMDALNKAQGVQASKLYLTQMVEHHRVAISMAQNEIKTASFQV